MPTVLETALTTVPAALLECVRAALALTAAGAPARVCVVPGELAWDDCECGLLGATVGPLYQSMTGTTPAGDGDLVSECPPPYLGVDVSVTVLRCAPQPVGNALAPTCDALDAAALTWVVDEVTVRDALACCLRDLRAVGTVAEFVLRDTATAGPEGMCVGSHTRLTFGVPNCLCAA